MANPQPTDAHGIIAHDIQENLLIRDFTLLQLKIIYLVIRLSWGCGNKSWQYNSYRDFEVIGIYKGDVATQLKYLKNNNVLGWNPKYSLISFNKDFDQWKIPINKRSSQERIKTLVHDSLKKANEVRNLLTVLGKNEQESSEFTNGVSEKRERDNAETHTDSKDCMQPKESIKESIKYIYTHDFEKFYSLYPRAEEKQRTYKNWKTCLKEERPDILIQAGINYKDKVTGERTEKRFIKTSANFLGRDKFYKDYIDYKASDASKYADVKI